MTIIMDYWSFKRNSTPQNGFLVKDRDLEDLIRVLENKGVSVDRRRSVKKIEFNPNGVDITSTVPFDVSLTSSSKLTGFTLRGNDCFELEATDYRLIRQDGWGAKPSINVEEGIRFSLKYGSPRASRVNPEIKETLRSFYKF